MKNRLLQPCSSVVPWGGADAGHFVIQEKVWPKAENLGPERIKVSIGIIVDRRCRFQGNPLLKTKKQWRKDSRRKFVKGAKPVDYFDLKYTAIEKSEEIATNGTRTETKRAVAKVRQIPLYSIEQTQRYTQIGAVLLRDMYCPLFRG